MFKMCGPAYYTGRIYDKMCEFTEGELQCMRQTTPRVIANRVNPYQESMDNKLDVVA